MDKQAKAIAKHLTDMQKILKNSEKTTQTGANKIISAIASEVDNTYSRLGKFMESGLARIDAKQEALETAVNDKDSILKDLHNTAKDLGTISNASGRLLEKFNALAKEMDGILTTIQTTGAIGLGGIYVEMFADVTRAMLPVTGEMARTMIGALKSSRLLTGYRGQPERDIAALADLIVKVSDYAVATPELVEMDINPVWVGTAGEGVMALDAVIVVEA